MDIPNLSEALIRHHSTAQSFERGQDLLDAVFNVLRRGDQIIAQVQGSQYDPYIVSVELERNEIVDATCTCPYDWGGWCKHIVATLLVCMHHPERIKDKQTLQELLDGLDRDQLCAVLVHLTESDAGLIEQIEQEVALMQNQTETPAITVDQQAIRRQVHDLLHSLDPMRRSQAYWQVGKVIERVRQVLARVWSWIDDGDAANALAFLEAVTDVYVAEWQVLDDSDGDPSGFFADLGDAWEEAMLVADLSPDEQVRWTLKIAGWQAQLAGYELDDVFEGAQMALESDDEEDDD